ncbi:MAG: thioredoxin family protein [Gemmatimonadetes bacterium]|nr:thioredoxin family protein [Gemmatimonadota bacterium]
MTDVIEQGLGDAISYDAYFERMARAAAGEVLYEKESWNFFTRLNHQRMKRLGQTLELVDEVVAAGARIPCAMTWLVLTEGWCGDAAQVLPALNLLTQRFENLEMGLLFRDRHLPLMDRFLTNGGRSIPKVLMVDRETHEVRGAWGPRPRPAQDLFELYRDGGSGMDKDTYERELQKWYLRDRAEHIQRELLDMLTRCGEAPSEPSVSR